MSVETGEAVRELAIRMVEMCGTLSEHDGRDALTAAMTIFILTRMSPRSVRQARDLSARIQVDVAKGIRKNWDWSQRLPKAVSPS